MPEFNQPPLGQAGEALRFLESLSLAWDLFASMETDEPILTLTSPEMGFRAVNDLPGAVGEMWGYLLDWNDPPGASALSAVATVAREQGPFHLTISGLAHDDDEVEAVLLVEFDDGTALTADLEFGPEPSAWVAAVSRGEIQRQIEEIVALAVAAELADAFHAPSDRRTAQALLDLLAELGATPDPPRGVVSEVAGWLWRKVDLFLDEATKTGGKAAGILAVGAVGYSLQRHAPQLAEKLRVLVDAAR